MSESDNSQDKSGEQDEPIDNSHKVDSTYPDAPTRSALQENRDAAMRGLCAEVERLEKENAELRQKARQGGKLDE